MNKGMSKEEAYKQAFNKLFVQDTATSAAGGALSSLMMGAAPMAINGVNYVNDTVKTGKEYRDAGAARGVVDEGLKSDTATDANKYAQKLRNKDENGKPLTNWNVGQQVRKNEAAIQAENRLLKSLQKNTGVETNVADDIPGANGKFTPNTGEAAYSVQQDADGNKYVKIEEDILDGVPKKDWVKTVKNVLKDKFSGGIEYNGENISVSGKSRGEFTNSKYTTHMSDSDKADKFRMSNNLDEIINTQSDVRREWLKHSRIDDILNFEKGTIPIKVGENDYTGEVVIASKADGTKQFYDIVNLEETKIQPASQSGRTNANTEDGDGRAVSFDNTDAVPRASSQDVNDSDRNQQSVSSDNSIPNSGENVKKKLRGRVDISANADTSIPATAGHEFTHAFKANAPEAYNEFESYILQAAVKTNAQAVNERMSELKRKFGYTDDVAREEVAAEVAESFLRDRDSIDDLINDYPTLADKISQAITSAKARLKSAVSSPFRNRTGVELTYSQLNRAEKLWSKALKATEASENTTDGEVKNSVKEDNAGADVEDLSTEENTERFVENVDKVFSGEMPERSVITIGDTPSLLQDYGASDLPITINQSTMYKIAYPTGYFGAEKQGHNLGIPALKQLPKQIADPMAILKSNSQDNSLILLTEWEDTEGNPVIIPLHLDKDGAIGFSNEVASAYGKGNIDAILTDEDGKSTVKYTKNNENIHQLAQSGLQLPGAPSDDTLINYNIPNDAEKVKYSAKENSESDTAQTKTDAFKDSTGTQSIPKGEHLMESEPEAGKKSAPAAENSGISELMKSKGVHSPSELMPETVTRDQSRKERNPFKGRSGVKEFMSRAYTSMVDDMHPFWNYNKAFETATQTPTYGKNNPYKLAINAKDAAARAAYIVSDYMVDYDNNYVGKGLVNTIIDNGITKDSYEDFNSYLEARHALEWLDNENHGRYKKVFEEEYLNNPETMRAIIADFEAKYPKFKQAAEALYEWQRKLMKTWLVDTGVITQEQYDALTSTYPNYVPFFREDNATSANGIIQGFANPGKVIKEAAGSGKRMYEPIENIMYNVASYVNHATKHGVMKAAVNLYDQLENDAENNILRQYWEEVYPIGGEVSDKGAATQYYSTTPSGDADIEDVTQAKSNSISQTLRDHREGVRDQNVVMYTDNGKKRYFKIYDKGLLDVMDNTQSRFGGVWATLAAVSRVRAALITSWNPAFSLASNPTRDFGTLILNSSDSNKAKIAGAAVKAYGDIFKASDFYKKHFAKDGGDGFDNPYEQYLSMGGQYSSISTEGMNSLKTALQKLQAEDPNMVKRFFGMFPKLFNSYQTVSDAIEGSPRLGEFKRTREEGYDYHEAFYRAKDVTTNFSRGGRISKVLNSLSNFFNASVQGVDKFFRQAKNNPKSFAMGIACLTAAELLHWGWNTLTDDEDKREAYDNLSNYTKNNFYTFYIGNGKFISIPKARESAVISTAIGAALDKYVNGQEDRFEGFFADYILSQFLPDGSIIGLSTYNDLRANKDYRDMPIVSSSVEDLPKELQYDDSTSYLARWIGSIIKQSPMQIDYIINNETGMLGKINKTYFSPSGQKNVPAMLTFGANSTFLKDSFYSTDKVNMFYDNKNAAVTKANGYPTAENTYLSNRYTQAGQVLSAINTVYKAEDDDETARAIRLAYVNYADSCKDNPSGLSDEVYEKIKGLYTQNNSIISLPKIEATISYDGAEYTFETAEQIIAYQQDLNNSIDEAYREVLSSVSYSAMSAAEQAKALVDAKSDAVSAVKQYYIEHDGASMPETETSEITAPSAEEVQEYTKKQEYEAEINSSLEKIAAAAGKSEDALKINDMQSVKINDVSYALTGDTKTKVIEAANEEYYSNVEKLSNNEINIEDVIGYTDKGKAHTGTQADGTKVAFTGKLYNEDGTPRFDDVAMEKIFDEVKSAAKGSAAARYADEITGAKTVEKTSEETTEASEAAPSLQSNAGGEKHFVPNSAYSAKSSGGSSGSHTSSGSSRASSGSSSAGGGGTKSAFSASKSAAGGASAAGGVTQRKMFTPSTTGAFATASTGRMFVPSTQSGGLKKLKSVGSLKALGMA